MASPIVPLPDNADWRMKIVHATRSNTTRDGALFLAIIGMTRPTGYAISPTALVLPNGDVDLAVRDESGNWYTAQWKNGADEIRRIFTGLAEKLKLTDAEVDELYEKIRAWIWRDLREGGTDLSGWYRYQVTTAQKGGLGNEF